ncbi:hypothetical protein [Mucilaginibacter ginsenosidivorans]|uniref:hypothetical protein n=1 Tax=Mucilaginibacter ginsenosidivorans TaxID=398053 RepID=UPI001E458E7B|nr:hypothetical protein [Mucilaginibacter ginsenosidivorans]
MSLSIRPAALDETSVLLELIALSARGLSAGYYTPAETESAIKYVFGVDTQLITDQTYLLLRKTG